jgi:glc operon protein GlcG
MWPAGRNSRHATGIILIERMDHAAHTGSVELAPGKARTAAPFKKPSQAREDAINHGGVAAVR